jgi:putative transcriptional regulator
MAARFRLAELIEAAGISQRELARPSGVFPTTINRMAANLTAQVSLATLDSLSDVLGVEPGDLIECVPERGRGRGK